MDVEQVKLYREKITQGTLTDKERGELRDFCKRAQEERTDWRDQMDTFRAIFNPETVTALLTHQS